MRYLLYICILNLMKQCCVYAFLILYLLCICILNLKVVKQYV